MQAARMKMAAAGQSRRIIFTDYGEITTAVAGPHTHAGLSFGPPGVDRILLAGIYVVRNSSIAFTGVTIGGEDATQLALVAGSGSNVDIALYGVVAGTGDALEGVGSGDVVASYDATTGMSGAPSAVIMASMYGVSSMTLADSATDNNSDPLSGVCDAPAGGLMLGFYMNENSGSDGVWTGLNELFDNEGSSRRVSLAVKRFSTAISNYPVSVAPSTASSGCGLILASWAP